MDMKWLITGGCGFLGTSLINTLSKNKEHSFRIIDNLTVGTQDDLAEIIDFNLINPSHEIPVLKDAECQLVIGDIRDELLTNKVCKDIDIIIHFAANTGVPNSVQNPRLDMECNVIGTFNMLEAARLQNIKRFVFASSGAPAGEVAPPIHEELPPHPVSPYGSSKLAGEGYCSSYFKTYGIETVALRFGNVYGPGSKHKSSVIAKFIKLSIEGSEVEIYGDGLQTRDFIYIDDLIDAVISAGNIENIGGEVFQIATAHETNLNELISILKPALKEKGIILKIKYSEKRLGDVMRNFSDTSKAKKLLNWHSKIQLPSGIEKTINSFTSSQG